MEQTCDMGGELGVNALPRVVLYKDQEPVPGAMVIKGYKYDFKTKIQNIVNYWGK